MNEHATTYRTRAGHEVTVGSRSNAFGQTVHTFECAGCDGIRGFKTADQADQAAQEHAGHCTTTPDAAQNGAAQ